MNGMIYWTAGLVAGAAITICIDRNLLNPIYAAAIGGGSVAIAILIDKAIERMRKL
jgi:hypothetical protein